MHGDRLFRPSQNDTPRYGYGLNINEITGLDCEQYAERLVTSAGPDWSPDVLGVHTFSAVPGLTMADALVRRPRWRTT